MKNITIHYNPQLKKEWVGGSLKMKWKEKFPELFSEEDFKLVKNQNNYHFGEWFGAIIFFLQGYNVFIEKYSCGGVRPEQLKRVKEIMGESNFEKMMANASGASDLFVFNEKTKQFFFVEVKVDNDKISDKQISFLNFLENENICSSFVLNLQPLKYEAQE